MFMMNGLCRFTNLGKSMKVGLISQACLDACELLKAILRYFHTSAYPSGVRSDERSLDT